MPVIQAKTKVRLPRITDARVAAVCAQLGDAVSLRNVQRVMGGSFSTLGPVVDKWRKNNPPVPRAIVAVPQVPNTVTEAIKGIADSQAAVSDAIREVSDGQEGTLKDLREVVAQLPRNADLRLREQTEKLDRLEGLVRKSATVTDIKTAMEPLAKRLDQVETALHERPVDVGTVADRAPLLDAVHAVSSHIQALGEQLKAQAPDLGGTLTALLVPLQEQLHGLAHAPSQTALVLDAMVNLTESVNRLTDQLHDAAARSNRVVQIARRQTAENQTAQVKLLERLSSLEMQLSTRKGAKRNAPRKSKQTRVRPVRPQPKRKNVKPQPRAMSKRAVATRTAHSKKPARKAIPSRKPIRKQRKSRERAHR